MAFVNDQSSMVGKQTVQIDVPHVILKETKGLLSYRAKLPNGHDYKPFLPENGGKPVVNLTDLRWFAHEDRKALFRLEVRNIRWSNDPRTVSDSKYLNIQRTLPKAIELAIKLGAEYIDPDTDAERKKRALIQRRVKEQSVDLADVPDTIDYNSKNVKELKLLAKIRQIPNYQKLKKADLVQILEAEAEAETKN